MQNTTTPPKLDGCLKTLLTVMALGGILIIVGIVFVFDQCSGNAEDRFERNESETLAKATLPDEYKSYQYIADAVSGDKYEIEELEDIYPSAHYFCLMEHSFCPML